MIQVSPDASFVTPPDARAVDTCTLIVTYRQGSIVTSFGSCTFLYEVDKSTDDVYRGIAEVSAPWPSTPSDLYRLTRRIPPPVGIDCK